MSNLQIARGLWFALFGIGPEKLAQVGEIVRHLDEAEARGRKAEKKEIADTIQEMSNQLTFVLHCDGFTLADLIRNSPLGSELAKKETV